MRIDSPQALTELLLRHAHDVGPGPLVFAEFDSTIAFARVAATVEWAPSLRADDLDPAYLLDLRLFGEAGEWRCWRIDGADEFSERLLTDAEGGESLPDELQALWGTRATAMPEHPAWSIVREARGISFAAPIETSREISEERPLRLRVRHYLDTDPETGLRRVADSRLVALEEGEPS